MSKRSAAAMILSVLLCLVSAFGMTALTAADAFTVERAQDLFERNAAVTLEADRAFPEGTPVKDDRRGLLITTAKEDCVLKLRREMSGLFDLDLRVFSKETGRTDLQKLVVTVTDSATGRSFDTVFSQPKEQETWGTGEASVLVEGANTGVAYLSAEGDTADEDGVMRGRELKGGLYHTTSFNNVVEQWFNDPLRMIFDPERMEVRVMTQHSWYRIMDLDDEELVKRAGGTEVYPAFERYSVSLRFAKLSVPDSSRNAAQMLIYSVNGQSLAGKALTDNAGPSLFAAARHNGVKGASYRIPEPSAYDVVDGFLPYAGTPGVTGPDGNAVPVSNGAFTPAASGVYTVTYPAAKDAAGNAGNGFALPLNVLEARPDFEISVDAGIEDIAVAPGTELALPAASAPDLLAVTAARLPVKLTVIRNTEAVYEVSDITKLEVYRFEDPARYTVRYEAEDFTGAVKRRDFTISVTEKAPYFTVGAFPVTLARDTAFTVPSCTARVGEIEVKASHTVLFPDGRERAESAVSLDMVGRYTVCYSAVSEGETYFIKKSFQVAMVAENLFIDERGCEVEGNAAAPDYSYPLNGVKITASRSTSTVRYANTIDVSKNTKKDVLIELMVTPPQAGTYEFSSLCVTLTDVHDADNTLQIYVNRCIFEGYYMLSLVRAGARGNTPRGWEWGVLQQTPTKGTNMTMSYYGEPSVGGEKAESGKLYYDNETKQIFVSYRGEQLECIDLDKTQDVGAGNEWTGFTTGEVLLSVTASELNNTTASYMILNVNGQSMAGEFLVSDKEPEFRVDYAGNSAVPVGLSGRPYPVFGCRVADEVSGKLSYAVEVFRDYATPAQKRYEVTDGAFTPDTAGSYTIVYAAMGKTYPVTVTVREALDPIAFAFENGGVPNSLFVGEEANLSGKLASGGSGDALTIEIALERAVDGSREPVASDHYRFLRQGAYEFVVTVTDYLGQSGVFRYPVTVTYGAAPVLDREPVMPRAILNHRRTLLPELTALDYFSDKTAAFRADAEIVVTEPDGTERVIGEDRLYEPKLSAPGIVSVRYRAYARFDKTSYLEKTYRVAVIDPVYKSDYFYSESEINTSDAADHASFTTLDEGAEMAFANALPAGVGLVFRVSPDNAGFERLDLRLADSEDASVSVLLSFTAEGGGTRLAINGTPAASTGLVKWGDGEYQTLQLDALSGKITGAAGARIAEITDTESGEAFASFPSGRVYLEIAYRGIEVSAGLDIRSLCGQIFNTSTRDSIGPEITVYGGFPKNAKINEVIPVPFARAVDALDPETTLTVTVRGPGGAEIYTDAPLASGMDFAASAYGGYTVSYVAEDSSGNVSRRIFYFTVKDLVPPTLLFYGSVPESGEAGKEIVLPRVEVTDNNDKDLQLYAHYTDPYAKMRRVENGRFTPEFPGTYTVTYYAEDSSNSYVLVNFSVTVR